MALSEGELQELYLAYFGRPADPGGMAFYQASTMDIWQVAAAFSASPESQSLYGGFSPAVIDKIYLDLFARDAEADGVLYWTREVSAGRLSAAGAGLAILLGAQGPDAAVVSNKLQAATLYTSLLDTPEKIAAYSGDAAAESARALLTLVTNDPSVILHPPVVVTLMGVDAIDAAAPLL